MKYKEATNKVKCFDIIPRTNSGGFGIYHGEFAPGETYVLGDSSVRVISLTLHPGNKHVATLQVVEGSLGAGKSVGYCFDVSSDDKNVTVATEVKPAEVIRPIPPPPPPPREEPPPERHPVNTGSESFPQMFAEPKVVRRIRKGCSGFGHFSNMNDDRH